MAKEEVSLPIQMEKLEIETSKALTASSDENPFVFRRQSNTKRSPPAKCTCKKTIKNTTFKRNSSKLLKEPVLKFIHSCCQYGGEGKAVVSMSTLNSKPHHSSDNKEQLGSPLQTLNLETLNVCALVENCKPPPSPIPFSAPSFRELRISQNDDNISSSSSSGVDRHRVSGSSCSQQALNPTCDVTIDELASYFETLVHIPKKMSTMAEMMYI